MFNVIVVMGYLLNDTIFNNIYIYIYINIQDPGQSDKDHIPS